jgi:hypothetical protein
MIASETREELKKYRAMWKELKGTKPSVIINFPRSLADLYAMSEQSRILRVMSMKRMEAKFKIKESDDA